jgi:hypothetical protein
MCVMSMHVVSGIQSLFMYMPVILTAAMLILALLVPISRSKPRMAARAALLMVRADGTNAFAILDTASNATFCSKHLADSLKLRGKPISLSLGTLHGLEKSSSVMYDLEIASTDGSSSLLLTNVIAIDHIPLSNAAA